MRIIAGRLGGQQFTSPHSHRTHPMSDKVRGALFNMLGDVAGLTILDPYGGTGALSFEALSRGAAHATLIELDKSAQKVIQKNIETLGLQDKVTFIPGNCMRWSSRYPTQQFDLALVDPPYDAVLIRDIARLGNHVKPDGLLVLSWPGHLKPESLSGFEAIKINTYGDAQLIFYRKSA
ncbi:MAG TPA: RsmD family RNA methyltransferase [Candidatus Saccharimonadales bacterium]|nr:RsmD family RNA methyltransferase [Candidatus Saccharimonadales bacterium]